MIRPARMDDLPEIERVYEAARAFMRAHGNPHQWSDWGYPEHALLVKDIEKRQLFVVAEAGAIHGVFAFIPGDDPTYAVIYDGQWPNALPYGTIHRIAGDGTVKGLVQKALDFALQTVSEVRADTHQDNFPMQGALQKCGFRRCGVIHLASGDPRIAYQFSKEANA